MKITCHSCQSKYTVSDEKVQGKTVKIKCRKCGTTILVNSSGVVNGAQPADPVSATSTADGEVTYTVNVAEGDQRTMTLGELVTAYNTSEVNAETYVWADGMADWMPLGQVDAVVAALNGGGAAAPAAATASPEPAPAAARAAVRKDSGKRGDVFGGGGGGAATQTADDVATSAPLFSAAAFSGGGAAAPAKAQAAAPTGAKEGDNSVLFSLSALTSKTEKSSSSSSGKGVDDSGLINLRALSAQAGTSSSGPKSDHSGLVPDGMGLFPLGAPILAAPQAASASISIPDAAPKNRSPIYLALGGAVALAAIVGVFFAMKGSEEKPVAENTAPTITATQPAPPPEPTPAPVAEATAAPSASASGGKPVPGRLTGKLPSKPGAPAPGAPATQPAAAGAPAGAPAAPAAPKKGSCGCAPNDLMCAMKCSTKK